MCTLVTFKRKYVTNVFSFGYANCRKSQNGLNTPFPMPGFTHNRSLYLVGFPTRKPQQFKALASLSMSLQTNVFIYISVGCIDTLEQFILVKFGGVRDRPFFCQVREGLCEYQFILWQVNFWQQYMWKTRIWK